MAGTFGAAAPTFADGTTRGFCSAGVAALQEPGPARTAEQLVTDLLAHPPLEDIGNGAKACQGGKGGGDSGQNMHFLAGSHMAPPGGAASGSEVDAGGARHSRVTDKKMWMILVIRSYSIWMS